MLEGTGIGPEVVGAALKVFAAVGEMLDLEFKIEPGLELREQPITVDRLSLSAAPAERKFGHSLQ